jgi:hypothetical protein
MESVSMSSTIVPFTGAKPATAPQEIMRDIDLCVWAADAEPGERLVYYRGHLGHDRMAAARVYPDEPRKRLNDLAARALILSDDGWVSLIQQRTGPAQWDYIAVKRAASRQRRAMSAIVTELLDACA